MIRRPSIALLCVVVLGTGVARAQDASGTEPNASRSSLPGSPSPLGLGLSPKAPEAPPAPGGRAPSFGAPTEKSDWTFRFSLNVAAWQAIGIGSKRSNATSQQHTTPLHLPARTAGSKVPVFSSTTSTLALQYGNALVTANVNVDLHASGKEFQGYYSPGNGPAFSQAYLTITPEPFGNFHVLGRVGAFSDAYGGPNQWGWGIYGPMLAIRGYGERIAVDYDQSPDVRWSFQHGIMAVPSVPENFVRGTYTGWTEPAISTTVQHAHIGFSYQNKYQLRLHFADARGTDERMWVDNAGFAPLPLPVTPVLAEPGGYCVPINSDLAEVNAYAPVCRPRHDGRMDVFLIEGHWWPDEWGQIGLTAGLWDFDHGFSVHDGIWWGFNYTKGGQDITTNYLGPNSYQQPSTGTGRLGALSAEWDFSVARILRAPAGFDGNAPDLRVILAGVLHKTLDTRDSRMQGKVGYMAGLELDYRMLSWFGVTLRSYAEDRFSVNTFSSGSNPNVVLVGNRLGRFRTASISPGIAFRTDWQSPERIELVYSHFFYNRFADNNPGQPLDHDAIMLGGSVYFY